MCLVSWRFLLLLLCCCGVLCSAPHLKTAQWMSYLCPKLPFARVELSWHLLALSPINGCVGVLPYLSIPRTGASGQARPPHNTPCLIPVKHQPSPTSLRQFLPHTQLCNIVMTSTTPLGPASPTNSSMDSSWAAPRAGSPSTASHHRGATPVSIDAGGIAPRLDDSDSEVEIEVALRLFPIRYMPATDTHKQCQQPPDG